MKKKKIRKLFRKIFNYRLIIIINNRNMLKYPQNLKSQAHSPL